MLVMWLDGIEGCDSEYEKHVFFQNYKKNEASAWQSRKYQCMHYSYI